MKLKTTTKKYRECQQWEESDHKKLIEAWELARKNPLFRDITKSSLIRMATIPFCEKIITSYSILLGKDKDAKQMLAEIPTW